MDTRGCNVALQMGLDFVRNDEVLGPLYASVCSPAFPAATLETLVLKMGHQLMRHWREPGGVQGVYDRFFAPTHFSLPDPPVSADARLSALLPDPDDAVAVECLSRLPDALLGNIISRLPVKDAARTAALSRRWRGVWRTTPLVLVDADLFPLTSTVSCVFEEHPGPIRCVHIKSCYMEEFAGLLASWLQILAAKGIQELVLVNRRWPLDLDLPSTFLNMATLTRLYLGFWKFPDTADLPRASLFPNLRELGLCGVLMESRDLDFILDRSPVLETLCVEGNLFQLRLRLVSQSLRCVQIIGSFEEIFVVDAPCLERLMHSGYTPDSSCNKVKIGHAPKLQLLGYLELDPGNHVLMVGNTIIKVPNLHNSSTYSYPIHCDL
jgi:hypothetical protein